ncbi:DJ-1/PfpI/YhbO family deglycase/protease [Corynebacterium sp. 3HC-13]|uniref:type 1 glutamine amidotransferase domain-containing protein n=1 Tax=Corynebacterium poyangense TaxID=2684405 RepID=UPI001CCC8045|nr:type 1 glutamine amidotransferase domain-containing protein [Corynebacterium poyangense]MBZ8176584.1 DJ-1/PfpI/YhbO family deglycase/protease [Corynebacterium poyangense]
MHSLKDKHLAVVATDGFEDSELTSPVKAVTDLGAKVSIVSTKGGEIKGKNGTVVSVDILSKDAVAESFDALLLPGGTSNADHIRMDQDAVNFVQAMVTSGRPTAAICHGAWILCDADVLNGRTLTSYPSLKTDLRNAGATWVDQEVWCDAGLVSSRTPEDLPAFNAKLIEEMAEGRH